MKKWILSLLTLGLATQALAVGGGNFSFWFGHRYNRNPIYYVEQAGHAGLFQDSANWFYNAAATRPVGHIPQNHDYVIISYFPTDWTDCFNTVTLTGFDFQDVSSVSATACGFNPITIEKTGSVKPTGYLRLFGTNLWDGHNEAGASMNFIDTASNITTILGDANFNDGSSNGTGGIVTGNCVFQVGADNFAQCATADFYNFTDNGTGGIVTGHANFYQNSTNNNQYGSADFYDNARNLECSGSYSQGYTAFHDSSVNNTALNNGADFYDSSGNNGGCNPLYFTIFHDSTYNQAGTNGPVFTGSSTQSGWSNDGSYFDQSSTMVGSGYSGGYCEAHDSATMGGEFQAGGEIHDFVIFSGFTSNVSDLLATGTSSVRGTVSGNCSFFDQSELYVTGTCNGDCDFEGDSNEFGVCLGNTTCNTTGFCVPVP